MSPADGLMPPPINGQMNGSAPGVTMPAQPTVPPASTALVRVTPDGGVTIEVTAPAVRPDAEDYGDFNENIAKKLSSGAQPMIVEEILQGAAADERSRPQ